MCRGRDWSKVSLRSSLQAIQTYRYARRNSIVVDVFLISKDRRHQEFRDDANSVKEKNN